MLKGRLWLTAILVVAPVPMIILMFIVFFPSVTRRAYISDRRIINDQQHITIDTTSINSYSLAVANKKIIFLYTYGLFFFYYLAASIFYGHYQERYRLPIMVVFIIPIVSYFITVFNKREFLNRRALFIKSAIILLFLTIWISQAKRAVLNTERLNKAIEALTVTQPGPTPLQPRIENFYH
jgi:hypothetical protein